MPTTFNWIHLGTTTARIDQVEGDNNSENAGALTNTSWGSSGSPLHNNITSTTMVNNGGSSTGLDTDNTSSNDQFTTNIGSGTQTFTYDGLAAYTITLTYADGTSVTTTAIIAQSTTGELFLAPPQSSSSQNSALTDKPIVSMTIGAPTDTTANFAIDRWMTGFDNGWIDGTGSGDLIDSTYNEPVANGSDRVDNGDGLSGSEIGRAHV